MLATDSPTDGPADLASAVRPHVDELRSALFAAGLSAVAQLLLSFGATLSARLMTGLGDTYPGIVFRATLPTIVNPPQLDANGIPQTPSQLVAARAAQLGAELRSWRPAPPTAAWFTATEPRDEWWCTWRGPVTLQLLGDPQLAPLDLTGPAAAATRARVEAEQLAELASPAAQLRARLARNVPIIDALTAYVDDGGSMAELPDALQGAVDDVTAALQLAGEYSDLTDATGRAIADAVATWRPPADEPGAPGLAVSIVAAEVAAANDEPPADDEPPAGGVVVYRHGPEGMYAAAFPSATAYVAAATADRASSAELAALTDEWCRCNAGGGLPHAVIADACDAPAASQ